jgi:hypothetical protein
MMTLNIEDDGNIVLNSKDRTVAVGISLQALKQATVGGEYKAITPSKAPTKDVTKMTIEEKMRYYSRIGRA